MAHVKFPEKQLMELRAFIVLVKSQPEVLFQPEMEFFKNYLESIGGVLPTVETADEPKSCPFAGKPEDDSAKEHQEEPEFVESDVELDLSGVVGMFSFVITRLSEELDFFYIYGNVVLRRT